MTMNVSNYTRGKLRLIDFVEAFDLGFTLGTVVKHVVRSRDEDKKRSLEELLKAKEYLEYKIEKLNR